MDRKEMKKKCGWEAREGKRRLCCTPGMDGVDAVCSGYDNCNQYKEEMEAKIEKVKELIRDLSDYNKAPREQIEVLQTLLAEYGQQKADIKLLELYLKNTRKDKDNLIQELEWVKKGNGNNQKLIEELEKELEEFRNTDWYIKRYKELKVQLSSLKAEEVKDGLVCPRCGKVFHDKDVKKTPNDYWTCSTCLTIQHQKCRHLSKSEEVGEKEIEEVLEGRLFIDKENKPNHWLKFSDKERGVIVQALSTKFKILRRK